MLNWDAVGAAGEILGAVAVIATLGYLARQTRSAQAATSDANRLNRVNGVIQMLLKLVGDPDLINSIAKSHDLGSYYAAFAEELKISPEEAGRSDWFHVYHFWLHWGQYSSSTTPEDLVELTNLVSAFYRIPAVRYSWNHSPYAKPILDPVFVEFVDDVLS